MRKYEMLKAALVALFLIGAVFLAHVATEQAAEIKRLRDIDSAAAYDDTVRERRIERDARAAELERMLRRSESEVDRLRKARSRSSAEAEAGIMKTRGAKDELKDSIWSGQFGTVDGPLFENE